LPPEFRLLDEPKGELLEVAGSFLPKRESDRSMESPENRGARSST
jgi:hypothetical protein